VYYGASSLCRGTACRVLPIHHGNAVMLPITKNYLIGKLVNRSIGELVQARRLSYYILNTIY